MRRKRVFFHFTRKKRFGGHYSNHQIFKRYLFRMTVLFLHLLFLQFLGNHRHGVGSYLNVHEGPHQIRMEWKPTPLVAGMTVTNEPGLYLAGKFGVRIENTMIIEPYMKTGFGEFLQLQPLTLCPIDKAPIDVQLLTDEELQHPDCYQATG